jgi:hypothetical protein
MLTIVKKNDSYDVITYQLENEDNSIVNLTGATVNFVMGKKNKLITNAKATVTSATSGMVSYQLTKTDTLVSGTFLAEFVVTFADGKQKTYPSNGYITVDIEQNLDTSQANVVVDMIAEKQGDFTSKLSSILLQAGNINMSAMNEYTWTATDGQLVFTFPSSANYNSSTKWFQVSVGNIPVDNTLVNRSYVNQFALTIDSSSIKAGMIVRAMWVEPIVPITGGHHATHELNGQDEIDISKLRNYQELVATPLADNTLNIDAASQKKSIYKKEVFKKLPFKFPDYGSVITQEGIAGLYPQAFTIDWTNNEIYILYKPFGGTSTKTWIAVYNLTNSAYKSCFNVATTEQSGGEGIVIKTESDNNRYLYVQTSLSANKLGKFLLNSLPSNKATIAPQTEYTLPSMDVQFNYIGKWIVQNKNTYSGNVNRRNVWSVLDDSFNQKGLIQVNTAYAGLFQSNFVDYASKHQSVTLANGKLILAMGGSGSHGTDKAYSYQGIRLFDQLGQLIDDGLINNVKMMDILSANGFTTNIIETEGVITSPTGEIYTFLVHLGDDQPTASTEGLVIFKEFSTSKNAIDFSSAAATYPNFNPVSLSKGVYPVINGTMVNPITGAALDTLDKICDMMIALDIPTLSFYSSTVTVKDINNNNIPSGVFVTLYNVNDYTIRAHYIGSGNNGSKKLSIYGASGSRVQEIVPDNDLLFSGSVNMVANNTIPLSNGKSNYKYLNVEFACYNDGLVAKIATDRATITLRDNNLANSTTNSTITFYEATLSVSETVLTVTQAYYQSIVSSTGTFANTKGNIGSTDMVITRVWGVNS